MSTPSANGELAESASSSGSQLRRARRDLDRAIGSLDADVDVKAERVVLPDDVAEELVVAAVVRRVDDPLVLPVRPRMRARWRRASSPSGSTRPASSARRSAIVAGTSAKVSTRPVLISTSEAISSPARCRSDRRPGGRRLHVLEPVDEVERDRVEQRELLLHRDREVGACIEALARLAKELIGGNALFVTHGAEKRSRSCTFDSDPRSADERVSRCRTRIDETPRYPAIRGAARLRLRRAQANGSSSRRETPAQLHRSTTAARAAARIAARSAGGSARSSASRRARSSASPDVERREVAKRRRIRVLEAGGDLGEPRVAGDERRAAGRGGLGCDHPERLGEDRRHDAGVREREQVPEMAVLERPGEERLDPALGRALLERRALRAEADDDEPRVDTRRARR